MPDILGLSLLPRGQYDYHFTLAIRDSLIYLCLQSFAATGSLPLLILSNGQGVFATQTHSYPQTTPRAAVWVVRASGSTKLVLGHFQKNLFRLGIGSENTLHFKLSHNI